MPAYNQDNIFHKIINGHIDCDKVYEDEHVIAFNDIQPAAPVHVLVLPKGEYCSLDDFANDAPADVVAHFFKKVRDIANDLGLSEEGYRVIANHGANASQTVHHFHMHILGGRLLGGLIAGDALNR
ncbi:MAG: histidine triad nucleotide-binding protein [Micavibrio sp.]|nr:histidine triad nucleotide-binding protein [Micavibrio sp.]|tara:strand:- start:503 stop:880 length:378 start_codon:yes stop_codon:yes gene_type:complete